MLLLWIAEPHYPVLICSKYVETTLEHCRRNYKTVVALPAINQVQTLCKILEGLLPKEAARGAPPPDKKLLEHHFVFACIWAFGGCLLVDKLCDYRQQFSRWWQSEHKAVVFPQEVRGPLPEVFAAAGPELRECLSVFSWGGEARHVWRWMWLQEHDGHHMATVSNLILSLPPPLRIPNF